MNRRKFSRRGAFCLTDLVVVLAIGTFLVGLVLPAVYSAQLVRVQRETINNLKTLAIACHNSNDAYKKMPPAFDKFGALDFPASIHVHLLPFIEQDNLYKAIAQQKGKGEFSKIKIPTFVSPDDPSSGKQNLMGVQNFPANLRVFANKGVQTPHDGNMPALGTVEAGAASIPRTFPDGTSNTIIFGTKYGYCGEDGGSRYASAPSTKTAAFFGQNAAKKKADPADVTATYQLFPSAKDCRVTPLMAQSFTKAGLQAALADGSVRRVAPSVSTQTWNAAMQPNDGMILGNDW